MELLSAHRSVVAKRSNSGARPLPIEGWRELHEMLKKLYG
jgi:hypothetical protein